MVLCKDCSMAWIWSLACQVCWRKCESLPWGFLSSNSCLKWSLQLGRTHRGVLHLKFRFWTLYQLSSISVEWTSFLLSTSVHVDTKHVQIQQLCVFSTRFWRLHSTTTRNCSQLIKIRLPSAFFEQPINNQHQSSISKPFHKAQRRRMYLAYLLLDVIVVQRASRSSKKKIQRISTSPSVGNPLKPKFQWMQISFLITDVTHQMQVAFQVNLYSKIWSWAFPDSPRPAMSIQLATSQFPKQNFYLALSWRISTQTDPHT